MRDGAGAERDTGRQRGAQGSLAYSHAPDGKAHLPASCGLLFACA
jgi:hypothetical protein